MPSTRGGNQQQIIDKDQLSAFEFNPLPQSQILEQESMIMAMNETSSGNDGANSQKTTEPANN